MPIENDDINITQSIRLLIIIDTLLVPLAYQQIYESAGVIKVIPYHIFIYSKGLKPQK